MCRFRKTKYLCGYYIKYAKKKINTRNVNWQWNILSTNALLDFPTACVIYITTFDKICVWSLYLFTSTNETVAWSGLRGNFSHIFQLQKLNISSMNCCHWTGLNAVNRIMSCNESLWYSYNQPIFIREIIFLWNLYEVFFLIYNNFFRFQAVTRTILFEAIHCVLFSSATNIFLVRSSFRNHIIF